MRRPVSLLAAVAALLALPAPAPAAAGPQSLAAASSTPRAAHQSSGRSWAQAEIRLVVANGFLSPDVASFRPDDPLTEGALDTVVAQLSGQALATVGGSPAAPVTIATLDAALVRAIGLSDAADELARGTRAAGLAPPARFGTEAVARLLGLRTDHPVAQEQLELAPDDTATRAEAAYSIAQILRFQRWEVGAVQAAAATFALSQMTVWQTRILRTAVSLIGYPYVWGGTSESPQAPLGKQVPGGFDCSGFAWRVFKSEPYPGGDALAAVLEERTSFGMSKEVPRKERIGFRDLQPADLLFFGAHGPRSKPAEVDHVGIYLGGGWLIHSSGVGVAIAPLTGWYRQQFAWARRPLAEAGLE
jgi:cell wall-associated NlpC family hydrolase